MNLKEKKLLVKMNATMGVETDQSTLDEIAIEELRLTKQQEEEERQRARISNKISSIFADLSKDINKMISEEKQGTANKQPAPPTKPQRTIIEAVVEKVAETTTPAMFIQPDPPKVSRDIQSIQTKLKLLEGWVSKIAMTGPGGGAGSVDQLDHRTQVVVSDSYNVGRHDYYIGVDYPGNVAVHLPTTVANGRVLVIKDESGSAAHYPITVVGRVDNDPDGFILKVNNGAVQLIYSNGWRII